MQDWGPLAQGRRLHHSKSICKIPGEDMSQFMPRNTEVSTKDVGGLFH